MNLHNNGPGNSPVCVNFTDTHRRQFYWSYNGYFHLKFKHVNKSHISFKGFIANKSWWLFQMSWFFFQTKLSSVRSQVMHGLVSPPHSGTQGSVCPARHFRAAGSRASESELLLTFPTPSHRTVVNPDQSKCAAWSRGWGGVGHSWSKSVGVRRSKFKTGPNKIWIKWKIWSIWGAKRSSTCWKWGASIWEPTRFE